MKIFVSYSTEDLAFARSFAQELRSQLTITETEHQLPKTEVFFSAESVGGGDEWFGRIQEELSTADVFLALVSSDYTKSQWCAQEWQVVKLGQFDKAIADYDAALLLNPKMPGSLYGRGLAKLKSGDASGGNSDMIAAKALKATIAEEFAGYGI